jgi:ADP-ribose 1''-phosphate phosphatase
MNQYKEVNGDLFTAKEYMKVHACNCKGVWGSGVAAIFKRKYPLAYKIYRDTCLSSGSKLLGTGLSIEADGIIGCLFTSYDFGRNKDYSSQILFQTKRALIDLFDSICRHNDKETYSIAAPKINSGLFNVEWEETKKVILEVLEDYPNITWTTYYL